MDPTWAAPFLTEALRLWGPWALVTALLGILLLASRRQNASLLKTNTRLQEQRVEDVQKMIGLADAMRMAMARRSEADVGLTEALRQGSIIPPAPPRLPQPEGR